MPSCPDSLRVGYVLKMYPRLSETFILDEILALEAAGVGVSVFSLRLPDEGRFHRDLSRVRASVSYLSPSSGSVSSSHLLGALESLCRVSDPGRALKAVLDFVALLPERARAGVLMQGLLLSAEAMERGLDHLHAHFMTVAAHVAHVAHLVTGLPFSVTAHAKDIYRHAVDAAVFGEIASSATAVVTVCEANRAFIRRHLSRDVQSRVVRIYNGVFADDLQLSPGTRRDPGLILGVGRLVEKKGFHVLLRACAVLTERRLDFSCVIVGEGEERSRLEAEARDLGLEGHVEFAGALPRTQVIELMQRARVLAAPYVVAADGNRDALPTVLLEALALGLPAVTTPIGGVPEIVEHGSEGLLVDEGDAEGLADAMGRMLQDDLFWEAASSRCRSKLVARFERHRTAADLLDVMSSSSPPSAAEGVA